MIISLPLPAAVAKFMNKASEEKMTRTDARVQEVTESQFDSQAPSYPTSNVLIRNAALNVARMVKMFGWEGKMAARIGEKRETELHWIKRIQWLDVSTRLAC